MDIVLVIGFVLFLIYLKMKHISELWENKESEMAPREWNVEYAGLLSMMLYIPIILVLHFCV